MFKNIKKDWWLANSIVWFAFGLIMIILTLTIGDYGMGLFTAGFNILIGIVLLARSKVGYWFALLYGVFVFIKQISRLTSISKQTGDFPVDANFIFSVVILVFALMLWQQVKKEKKVAVK